MEQYYSGRLDIPQPSWLGEALTTVPQFLLDEQRRMQEVLHLAQLNGLEHKTGYPLAGALLQDNGKWVAGGVEFVVQGNSALAHPAMVVIRAAFATYGERLFRDDVPGKEVPAFHYFGSSDQCSRCLEELGKIRRLKAIFLAATTDDVRETLRLSPSPPPSDWQRSFRRKGIYLRREFLREEARELLRGYQSLQLS
jgi:tRNA(Arg) A34 adenosine deaminase TadA